MTKLGKISPPDFGFTRIITVSYSAFDSFQIPGIDEDERRQISKDIERGTGRFIFCGLRDIVAELHDDFQKQPSENDLSVVSEPYESDNDRRTNTQLKSLDQLSAEFTSLISNIKEKDRTHLFEDALKTLLSDPSFDEGLEATIESLVGDSPDSTFQRWSTGHKISLHVLASITAHSQRKSLVLFDEPETHLHPPLIAALMRSIRIVLEQTNAFGIVATHSPVILQETVSRHVLIVERVGDKFLTRKPQMETFAESIGALTYDSFGLTAETTYFHETLKRLVASADNPDQINELFPIGLSAQAEAYVMALFARKALNKDG